MAHPTFSTLVELLCTRAAEQSQGRYLFQGNVNGDRRELTLVELDRRARCTAAWLQREGLAGETVVLCYPSGPEFLVGLFGCLYAGAIAVPADVPRMRRSASRLESIAEDCNAKAALTTTDVADRIRQWSAPFPRKMRWIDTAAIEQETADAWEQPTLSADVVAFLQYTSGSTGTPKGVMLTHGCVLHNVRRMAEVLGLYRGVRVATWLPAFHDMGLIGNLLQSPFMECDMLVTPPVRFVKDPLSWLRDVSEHRAFVSGGPNFALDMCIKKAAQVSPDELAQLDLSCWEVMYIGAEPISAPTLDRFVEMFGPYGFKRETYFPCYGLAEATLMVSGGPHHSGDTIHRIDAGAFEQNRIVPTDDATTAKTIVGCGHVIPDMEVIIVDPESGRLCPPQAVGEIWVAGPSAAAGYWRKPDDTTQTFSGRIPERDQSYLRTGDLGYLAGDELIVTGRIKELIIIRGANYYPHDLEETIREEIPDLRHQPSTAFVSHNGAESLVVVQEVPRNGKEWKAGELLRQARKAIAERFELEVHTLVLVRSNTLPKSSSGKLRRVEIERRFHAGELSIVDQCSIAPIESTAPTPCAVASQKQRQNVTAIQRWLVDRMARQVNVAPAEIDLNRPFAEYGLDSTTMVRIAWEFEQWLGRELPPTLLYEAPTIAALCHEVTEPAKSPASQSEIPAIAKNEPIAVVGMACRFPGADSVEAFWQLLAEGTDAVRALPEGRWPNAGSNPTIRQGGFLDSVDLFDADFFGVSPREAETMDPQHRLLLETAIAALEYGGVVPATVQEKSTGVFVGVSSNDYARLVVEHKRQRDPYANSGNAMSMAAHRLSYHLDLHGPSMAVDTACSSSLAAIHMACQSLRNGDCEMALAGGVNLILTSDVSESLAAMQMLSPDGACKTFDASANGYVRGEGCGVVVLKPLSAAKRDGDPIFAVVDGSAMNQDGRSNGITAPNGKAQARLIARALQNAGRTPEQISFVETHGTGTALGDPIEFDALVAALGECTSRCVLGAVKTNIGHLEAAAGIAGFIKVVLQLQHRQIAPLVHFREPNERLRWKEARFRFARRLQPWPRTKSPLAAGVSSFGFGGTNVHVILSEPPRATSSSTPKTSGGLFLLPLSAQHPAALKTLAEQYRDIVRDTSHTLDDVCFTASAGRMHRHHRLSVVAASPDEIADSLNTFLAGNADARLSKGVEQQQLSEQTAWVFTGQGSFYPGAALRLAECCPVFHDELHACQDILNTTFPISIFDLLAQRDERFPLQRTDVAQPLTLILQVALARTLSAFGLRPGALFGHSVGELAAVVVAGGMSLDDGLRLAVERGRAMQDECPEGAMLACFASVENVQAILGDMNQLAVAVLNGVENTVLAGSVAAIEDAEARLNKHDMDTRRLRVDRAFHSTLIEPALPRLEAIAAETKIDALQIPVVSNVTGKFHTSPINAEYWTQHARSTVQFAAGLDELHQAGITHFVEIGPDAILCSLGRSHPSTSTSCWLPTMQRERDDWRTMLECLGRLYTEGASLDWEAVHRGGSGRRIVLPTYPFQRRRMWIDGSYASEANPWMPWSNWKHNIPRAPIQDVSPKHLADQLATQIRELQSEHRLDRFDELQQAFQRLTTRYVLDIFAGLGWQMQTNERLDEATAADRFGVIPQYHRLMRRLLNILTEDGVLQTTDDGWRVAEIPDYEEADATHQQLLNEFPAFATELRLAHRCVQHMADVMTGTVDPLHVLFGDEGAELTERLYEKSPFAQFYNQLTAKAVEQIAATLPENRTLRILEVGAGTGGTTTHVLPRLPADRCEYVFSDVSNLFLHRAEEKFRAHPFVHYELLDLEADLADQPFASGQFDLILAANVIHATKDVRASIRNIHRLLTPGGMMLLLEGTKPLRLLDLIFGLTDGWWRFEDTELRPEHPLLSVSRWRDIFQQEGFTDAAVLPNENAVDASGQYVFAARRGDPVDRNGKHSRNGASCSAILFRNGCKHADSLMGLWSRNGDRVIAAETGDRFQFSPHLSWLRPAELDDWKALLDGAQRSPDDATPHIVYWWNAKDDHQSLDELATMANERDVDLTIVTSGRFDFAANQFESPLNQIETETVRWVDLDPNDAPAIQYACLAESVRRPDKHRIVAFRGGQRYVQRQTEPRVASADDDSASALDKQSLLAADPEHRSAILERHLRREFAEITGIHLGNDDVDRPLNSFGLDSLMAIQLRNRVEADLHVSLSLVDFLKGLSLQQIVANAVQQLNGLSLPADVHSPEPSRSDESIASTNVEQLSEGELDSLLHSFLQQG